MSKQNFAIDATMGGSPIINEAYLHNVDNFNFSFVNKRNGYMITSRTDSSNIYTKICEIKCYDNDAYALARFTLIRFDGFTDFDISFMDIIAKVGIRGDKSTGIKQGYVHVVNSKRLYKDNIIAIVTQNDVNGYAVQLYFKHNYDTYGLMLMPQIEKVNYGSKASIQYFDSLNSQNSLPAGTQLTVNGGTYDIIPIYLFYDTGNSKFQVQFLNYSSAAYIVNNDDNAYLYDTPTWDTDGVVFPSTSIIRKSSTNILSLNKKYINGTTMPYTPMIVDSANTRKIRFLNSSGSLVTTVDGNMACMLTIAIERR